MAVAFWMAGVGQRRWLVQAIPRAAEAASQFIGRLGKQRAAGTPMARLARSREIGSLFPLADVGSVHAHSRLDWAQPLTGSAQLTRSRAGGA